MPVAKDTRGRRSSGRSYPRTRVHRPQRRGAVRRFGLFIQVLLVMLGLVAVLTLWASLSRVFARPGNTNRSTFDAIVVLGTPADSDGNPTPQMLDRVTEAVREYDRGVAPRLILTGGAAHNGFVEAEVMARVAESQGVPPSVILQEPQALDTMQNACNSVRILKSRGWHSAEVVTSGFHAPRAAMIFSHLPIEFRVHSAPEIPDPSHFGRSGSWTEILKTVHYLVWSRWAESCSL